jgi:DNA-binding beta-propeller fold protein YncE
LEPTALVLHDKMLFVANTNSDTISIIDPKAGTLAYTFPLFPGVAYGSQPNDINFLPDGTFVVSLEAISHSPYWKDNAIFVTEDDAQDGVDHVDGHRTEGLVISPFVKRNVVDSTYYNQLSIIRTIE